MSVHDLNGNEMELQLLSHSYIPELFSFDSEVQEVSAKEKAVICFADEPTAIRSVTLTGQEWEEMTDIYSGMAIAEAGKNEIASVKAKQYGGFLYTVTSYSSGASNEIHAWQLIPERLYTEATMDKVDWPKVHAEKSHAFSYLGLRVKVAGQVMICAKPVNFLRGLPTVAPLSMSEAQTYDKERRSVGWRPHTYGADPTISWHKLAGHPVVIYESEGKRSRGTLICRIRGEIQDFHLSLAEEGLNFDTDIEQAVATSANGELGAKTFGTRPKRGSEVSMDQACLF